MAHIQTWEIIHLSVPQYESLENGPPMRFSGGSSLNTSRDHIGYPEPQPSAGMSSISAPRLQGHTHAGVLKTVTISEWRWSSPSFLGATCFMQSSEVTGAKPLSLIEQDPAQELGTHLNW